MIWRIHHKAVTESTNLDARDGMPGDVFTADEQTAGRGRLDHKWLSPPGENLMLSAVIGVDGMDPARIATLPLVVGLAAATAIDCLIGPREAMGLAPGSLPILVKWPNDVLADGRKIAGILCERHGDNVIAGVGMNVNQKVFPPQIALRAASLCQITGRECPVDRVRTAFLNVLAPMVEDWRQNGFASLYPLIVPLDALKGRHVSVMQTDGDTAPASGVCGGIQVDGTLLVGGRPVYAGEAHVLAS